MSLDLTQVEPYRIWNVRDLLTVPPPQMIIRKILPRATVTGLSAYPGVGKTWLAAEFARAIATGTKFLGEFDATMGNVIFVGKDSSIHDYAQQMRKLFHTEMELYDHEIKMGARRTNPFDDRMHFILKPDLLLEDQKSVMRLARTAIEQVHSEGVETRSYWVGDELVEEPETQSTKGTDLIVLDTLASMTRTPENDNTQMDYVFRNVRWLAEVTHACIILIHHSGKPTEYNHGESWRGGSAQEAALDNWFHIMHPPRAPRDKLLLKVKRFRGLKPDNFHYWLRVDEETARLEFHREAEEGEIPPDIEDISLQAASDSEEDKVLALLRAHKGEFFKIGEIARTIWEENQPSGLEFRSFERRIRRLMPYLVEKNFAEDGPNRTYRLAERAP